MQSASKQTLGGIQLWAIAVGMVISGQYFGWNYALIHTNTLTVAVALLFVSVFYMGFMHYFLALSINMPQAGGVMLYLQKLVHPHLGALAGYAALAEYFFAVSAISVATGAYLHTLLPWIHRQPAALTCLLLCALLNRIGIKQSARFEVAATLLALAGIVAFNLYCQHNVPTTAKPMKIGVLSWLGVLHAVPFLLWLYLGIEGCVLSADKIQRPKKTLPRSVYCAMLTLLIGALVTVLHVAILVPHAKLHIDNPLPFTINRINHDANAMTLSITVLGLLGLLASLNGIFIASIQGLHSLTSAGYIPAIFNTKKHEDLSKRSITVITVSATLAVIMLPESMLLELSILGALMVYCGGLIAWFALAQKTHHRRIVSYIGFGLISLLAILAVVAVITNL